MPVLATPVLPTRKGTWQHVNNVERRCRQIRQDTGLEWVTPHTFRKTVATLISEPVNSETASQQLGHSSPTITREFYIAKPAIAADVVHVLQSSPTRPAARTTQYVGNKCGIAPSSSGNGTGSDSRFRRSEPVLRSG